MFQENQQIGNYTLVRKLGRGGFGEVWLAEKRARFVTTKVAVKLPHDEQIDHKAIRQEATLWEQASGHPNILPIIDADEYDGQIVIVSEYAPDGSLEQWLKTHGKMSIEKAVETTIQILDGLEFLHSRNIIHRDLKPANILLQGKTPRLADFGISRALRTTVASQSQHISGTFAYMSPEALHGKRSVQTDVWSVGVNLYQFLTGTLPFPQKEPSVLLAAIMMREFAPLPDSIPQNLKNVIAKALVKLPENRYASANEMREDLRKFLVNISLPHLVSKEIFHRPVLPENITIYAKSETEQETVINAKSANHLTVTKPSYSQDSFVTRMKEKESVVTHLSGMKENNLSIKAQLLNHTPYWRKKNAILFTLVGGFLVVLGLIGIVAYNSSNLDGIITNTNKLDTATNKNKSSTATAAKGEVWKNSIGMDFVYISSGDFMMGSNKGVEEKPIHKVTISNGFWMGKTEVTQTQWQVVMGNNPSFNICPQCPVERVSWGDVQSFISKLNAQNDDFKYRLPSEAEWEYAARTETSGDYVGNLDSMAWYGANSGMKTHPVGMKQA